MSATDVYIAGRTKNKRATGEGAFHRVIQNKDIQQICFVGQHHGNLEPSKAFVLKRNGQLHQWGHQKYWYREAHVERRLFHGAFLSQVTQVACGENHFAAVKSNGALWTWGEDGNHWGELGRETASEAAVRSPGSVDYLVGRCIQQVACSAGATFALDKEGKLYSFGFDAWGITGQGQDEEKHYSATSPAQIIGVPSFQQIVSRDILAGALTSDGKVYTWGMSHWSGHVHHDEQKGISRPKLLPELMGQTIVQISCGDQHMGAINDQGELWMWGDNSHGQLGLTTDDSADWEFFEPQFVNRLKDQNIGSISCGKEHSIAVTEDGASVYVWGSNDNGQLGVVTNDWKVPAPRKIDDDAVSGKVTSALASDLFTILVTPTTLTENQTIFNNPESNPDIRFVSLDGSTFLYAHTKVLCAKSTYVDNHIQQQTSSQSSTMTLISIQHPKDIFTKVIGFLYGIEMDDVEPSQVSLLFEAAHFYGVSDLKVWCCHFLEEYLKSGKDIIIPSCKEILEKHNPEWLKDQSLSSTSMTTEYLKQWLVSFSTRETSAPRKRKAMNGD